MNRYVYAEDNPTLLTDPLGLSSEADQSSTGTGPGKVLGAIHYANTDLPNTDGAAIARYEVNLFGKAIIPGGVFLSIPEITVNGALADLSVINYQLQAIASYAGELSDGYTTLSDVVREIRGTSYLPGLTADRLRYLILKAANAQHIHLSRAQWQ